MENYKIKHYILIILCISASNYVYSCEPATPDWITLFKTADKKTAKDIYTRLMATIYSNMENFPQRQSSSSVTWVQNDVTIVVSYTEQKDEDGQYVVLIRRYNNHVLG